MTTTPATDRRHLGVCRRCGVLNDVKPEDVLHVKHSGTWYARCRMYKPNGATRWCGGDVVPPPTELDEEAMAAALMVGGPRAALEVWDAATRRSKTAAARRVAAAKRKLKR